MTAYRIPTRHERPVTPAFRVLKPLRIWHLYYKNQVLRMLLEVKEKTMTAEEKATKTPQELLDYYSSKIETLGPSVRKFKYPSRERLRRWAYEATRAAYKLHPELREDNSLPRYFVARAGRRMGFRGEDLTWFVEKSFETGMSAQFIPQEVLGKGEVNHV